MVSSPVTHSLGSFLVSPFSVLLFSVLPFSLLPGTAPDDLVFLLTSSRSFCVARERRRPSFVPAAPGTSAACAREHLELRFAPCPVRACRMTTSARRANEANVAKDRT